MPGDDLSRRLAALSRIAKRRFSAREAAGGLDFDTVEARVRLDDEGHPVDIDLRRKTEATSLIEEAMILANETVAAYMRDARFPSVYRVHEKPAADSLAALVPVFQEFPWFDRIDRDRLVAGDPSVIQQVLEASAARAEGELVSSLVLRSMKRALYRPSCEPHYVRPTPTSPRLSGGIRIWSCIACSRRRWEVVPRSSTRRRPRCRG